MAWFAQGFPVTLTLIPNCSPCRRLTHAIAFRPFVLTRLSGEPRAGPTSQRRSNGLVHRRTLTRPATVSGDVHRYGLPRSDLNVSVDGVALKPAFALGGWLAFEPMGDAAMMMGDLVLTESEINPVMEKAGSRKASR